jgi:hypothetical protein
MPGGDPWHVSLWQNGMQSMEGEGSSKAAGVRECATEWNHNGPVPHQCKVACLPLRQVQLQAPRTARQDKKKISYLSAIGRKSILFSPLHRRETRCSTRSGRVRQYAGVGAAVGAFVRIRSPQKARGSAWRTAHAYRTTTRRKSPGEVRLKPGAASGNPQNSWVKVGRIP